MFIPEIQDTNKHILPSPTGVTTHLAENCSIEQITSGRSIAAAQEFFRSIGLLGRAPNTAVSVNHETYDTMGMTSANVLVQRQGAVAAHDVSQCRQESKCRRA